VANTNLSTIKRKGRAGDLPGGTEITVAVGSLPRTARIGIKLPGTSNFTDLGDIAIVNEILEVPVPITFLCHALEDKPRIRELDAELRRQGILTWFDERDLRAGEEWQRAIERAIAEADYVLVCASSRSISKTGFVNREIRFALQEQERRPLGSRYIIPIRLDECQLPHELSKYHWIDGDKEAQFAKLVRDLRQF
jgi:hypothetical protein